MKQLLLCFLLVSGVSFAHTAKDIKPAIVSVSVKSESTLAIHTEVNAMLEFYLFDVEGNLVHQLSLKSTAETIKGLKKGSYLYNVFKNDDLVATGQVTVK